MLIPWPLTGQACASRTSIYFLVKLLDKDFLLFGSLNLEVLKPLAVMQCSNFKPFSPSILSFITFVHSIFFYYPDYRHFLLNFSDSKAECDYSLVIFPLQMEVLGTLRTHHESNTFGRRAGSPTTSWNILKLCQSIFFEHSFHLRSNLDAFLNLCGYWGASRRQNIYH